MGYIKSNRKIQLMSATEYVINKYKKRHDYTERISPDGKNVFISVKTGEVLSRKELDEIYPTPQKLFFVENSDPRNNWMNNIKSF